MSSTGTGGSSPAAGRAAADAPAAAANSSAPPPAAGSPPHPLAPVVFAALVLASFAAFFVTQRLKHTPTVVQRFMLAPYFAPIPRGANKLERISFRIKQADAVTVTVINAAGASVATLAHSRPLARYTQLSLRWNGRAGTPTHPGAPAPAGEYRVRVTLHHQHRSVLSPHTFKLVRTPRHPAPSSTGVSRVGT
ncbi:MAG TPA: hypothetical protein VLJ42_10365 [Solirubrobacteraceae bacterium]|nr:hypothetical protein [Solirubrobacteraceae bacterium]